MHSVYYIGDKKEKYMLQEEKNRQKIMINKSRAGEEANGEDTSEIRSQKERGNYQEHWTL